MLMRRKESEHPRIFEKDSEWGMRGGWAAFYLVPALGRLA